MEQDRKSTGGREAADCDARQPVAVLAHARKPHNDAGGSEHEQIGKREHPDQVEPEIVIRWAAEDEEDDPPNRKFGQPCNDTEQRAQQQEVFRPVPRLPIFTRQRGLHDVGFDLVEATSDHLLQECGSSRNRTVCLKLKVLKHNMRALSDDAASLRYYLR